MVKKKVSGQTVAIIILIVLLICAITFGGVYAFYSTNTNKVISSTITMASLDISFKEDDKNTDDGDDNTLDDIEGVIPPTGQSGYSQILITNKNDIVPNELLCNSPLSVVNGSETPVYVAVLYRVQKAPTDDEGNPLDTIYKKDKDGNYILDSEGNKQAFGVIDIGTEVEGSPWADFVFDTSNYPEYQEDSITANDKDYIVRCFVTVAPQGKGELTVIYKNTLKLHREVGNEFQNQRISFTFQAHAIAASSLASELDDVENDFEKYSIILKAIYESTGWSFSV